MQIFKDELQIEKWSRLSGLFFAEMASKYPEVKGTNYFDINLRRWKYQEYRFYLYIYSEYFFLNKKYFEEEFCKIFELNKKDVLFNFVPSIRRIAIDIKNYQIFFTEAMNALTKAFVEVKTKIFNISIKYLSGKTENIKRIIKGFFDIQFNRKEQYIYFTTENEKFYNIKFDDIKEIKVENASI